MNESEKEASLEHPLTHTHSHRHIHAHNNGQQAESKQPKSSTMIKDKCSLVAYNGFQFQYMCFLFSFDSSLLLRNILFFGRLAMRPIVCELNISPFACLIPHQVLHKHTPTVLD